MIPEADGLTLAKKRSASEAVTVRESSLLSRHSLANLAPSISSVCCEQTSPALNTSGVQGKLWLLWIKQLLMQHYISSYRRVVQLTSRAPKDAKLQKALSRSSAPSHSIFSRCCHHKMHQQN